MVPYISVNIPYLGSYFPFKSTTFLAASLGGRKVYRDEVSSFWSGGRPPYVVIFALADGQRFLMWKKLKGYSFLITIRVKKAYSSLITSRVKKAYSPVITNRVKKAYFSLNTWRVKKAPQLIYSSINHRVQSWICPLQQTTKCRICFWDCFNKFCVSYSF